MAEVLPLGLDGVVVRFALTLSDEANRAALSFAAAVRSADLPGLEEVLPTPASVYLRFDPGKVAQEAFLAEVAALSRAKVWAAEGAPRPERRWTLPCAFDASAVAERIGISRDAAEEELRAADLRVLAIGFAPGQPYLGLLPKRWDLPRRDTLVQVPAGALVVALRQLVLFGAPSATGWHQVGHCAFRPFRMDRPEQVPLRIGDALRLTRASAEEIAALENDALGGAQVEQLA